MARYTGAVCRLCRRSGGKLFLKGDRCFGPKCSVDKRPKPPGQQLARRRKVSDRGLQLREKQKARYVYGLLERQFHRTFITSERQTGITGDNLLILLERRLDNIIFRLGFASSRNQARQLVQHGHFLLNGHKNSIPSALVKEGDNISWREASTKTEYYKDAQASIESRTTLNWLSLDTQKMEGKILSLPTAGEVDSTFDGKAIVEWYSR